MKQFILAAGILGASSFAGSALSEQLDQSAFDQRHSGMAVSDLNAKVEFGYAAHDFGGNAILGPFIPRLWDSGSAYFVQGAVSFPLDNQFGAQIDAGYMNTSVDFVTGIGPVFPDVDIGSVGVGGHLFWRDSHTGLLGIYGHFVEHDISDFGIPIAQDITTVRVIAELERYLDNLTLKASGGVDQLDLDGFGDSQYLTVNGEIDIYLDENFMFFAGIEHQFEQTSGRVGFEALFDNGGTAPALFAEAAFSSDTSSVMAGLRVYFAPEGKSLMRRHREDDPGIDLFDNFDALGQCLAFLTPQPVGPVVAVRTIGPITPPQLDGCELTFPATMMSR